VYKLSVVANKDLFIKEAFSIKSIIEWIGNSVQESIGSQVDFSSTENFLRTLSNFLVPATLFGFNPVLGLLASAAEEYCGFNAYDLVKKIVKEIWPKIESGEKVSPEEVNSAAGSALGISSNGSFDFFDGLRELEYDNRIFKSAYGYKKENWVYDIVESIAGHKRRGFVAGVIVWILKRVLLSLGLLAVGGGALSLMGIKPKGIGAKPSNESNSESTSSSSSEPLVVAPSIPGVDVPPSTGAGSQVYRRNKTDIYLEPLAGRRPEEMVYDWAVESYPILQQYRDIVMSTPAFWNAVRSIAREWYPNETSISMPSEYSKRDDVLNMFIPYVFKEVQNKTRAK
jgi:hypothetical protein